MKEVKSFIQKTIIQEAFLNEANINNFFEFLEDDPQRMSQATIHYVYPMKTNKFLKDENGEFKRDENGKRVENPMFGKIFKSSRMTIKWEDTYKKRIERWEQKTGQQYPHGERRGKYEKVEGFSMLETGKNGLYFPAIPSNQESNYSIQEDGAEARVVEYDEIKPYIPVYKPSATGPIDDFRQLIVNRISSINAGGNTFENPDCPYTYTGPRV